MDIYIKLKKTLSTNKKVVFLEDIAQVISEDTSILKIPILKDITDKHPVRAIDIIAKINAKNKKLVVNIIGTDYMVVEKKGEPPSKAFELLKVFFIAAILFTGCVTAIVTFHTETSLDKVLNLYAETFSVSNMSFLYIPYAIGIGVGIIIFFNHAFSKKLTSDPTPIEVEMNAYSNDIIETLVEAEEEKKNE